MACMHALQINHELWLLLPRGFSLPCDSAQFLSLHFVGQTWNNTNFTPKIKETRNNISGIQENSASNTSPSLPWLVNSRYPSHGHCPRVSRALSSLAWAAPGMGQPVPGLPTLTGKDFWVLPTPKLLSISVRPFPLSCHSLLMEIFPLWDHDHTQSSTGGRTL